MWSIPPVTYGSGIHRKLPRTQAEAGVEYRSKVVNQSSLHNIVSIEVFNNLTCFVCFLISHQRAHGDVKQQGKPDPYAYIQLNRQKLNKRLAKQFKVVFSDEDTSTSLRKQTKLSGQFNSFLKKGKRGSSTGTKLLNKKRRRIGK